MVTIRIILLFVAIVGIGSGLPVRNQRRSRPVPPEPRFDGVFEDGHNHEEIGN